MDIRVISKAIAEHGLYVAIVVGIAILLYAAAIALVKKYLKHRLKPEHAETIEALRKTKRISTTLSLLSSMLKYITLAIVLYLVIAEFLPNERILPIAAGAGVFSIIVGISAQNFVKDVISGFFIVFEGQFSVGDLVITKGFGLENFGIVEELTLRITTIRGLNGDQYFIPNGNIQEVIRIDNSFHTYFLKIVFFQQTDDLAIKAKIKPLLNNLKKEFPYIMYTPTIHSINHVASQTYLNIKFMMIPVHAESFNFIADNLMKLIKSQLDLDEEPIHEILTYDTKVLNEIKRHMIIKDKDRDRRDRDLDRDKNSPNNKAASSKGIAKKKSQDNGDPSQNL